MVSLDRLEDGSHAVARSRRAILEVSHGGGHVLGEHRAVEGRLEVGTERDDVLGDVGAVPVDDRLEKLGERGLMRRGERGGEAGVEDDDLGLGRRVVLLATKLKYFSFLKSLQLQ